LIFIAANDVIMTSYLSG